jgi:transposase
VLTSEHEAILQRSKTQGAGRRRQRSAKGRSRKDLLGLSADPIKRWLKRRRETGDVEPKPIPGRPRLKGAALQEWLPSQLQLNNDLTLEEHSEAFEVEVGMPVSASTVGRAIARLPQGGWPIKKSRP